MCTNALICGSRTRNILSSYAHDDERQLNRKRSGSFILADESIGSPVATYSDDGKRPELMFRRCRGELDVEFLRAMRHLPQVRRRCSECRAVSHRSVA